MNKTLAILAFVLASAGANAQNITHESIIEQLPSAEASQAQTAIEQAAKAQSTLDGIETKQQQADKLKAEAKTASKSDAKKKLKQAQQIESSLNTQREAAYNMYAKSNNTLYGIYANNLKTLVAEAPESKQKNAQQLTENATNEWTEAAAIIKKVPTGKKADITQVVKLKSNANIHQLNALDYQKQEYELLLSTNSNTNKVTTQQNQFVASDSDLDDDGLVLLSEKTESVGDKIMYKVQIAADSVPLPLERLKQLYPTNEIINNEVVGGVFKYTIGYFIDYEEARKVADDLRNNKKVDAFVIKYINGKRAANIHDDHPYK